MKTLGERVDELLESVAPGYGGLSGSDHKGDIPKEDLSWWVPERPDYCTPYVRVGRDEECGRDHFFISRNWANLHSNIEGMMWENRERFPDIYRDI